MADTKISALTGATTPLAGTEVVPIVQSSTTKNVSVDNLTAGRTVLASKLGVSNTSPSSLWSGANSLVVGDGTSGYGLTIYTGNTANATLAFADGLSGSDPYVGYIQYEHSINDLTFATNAAEKLRLKNSGDLTVNTGNLVIGTSGKGIDFSANTHAAGMTSETLTWYEEGTFTPVVEGSSTPGTATYSLQSARYTRIGRSVQIQIALSWTSGTGTGNLFITGLPFTSANVSPVGAMSFALIDGLTLSASSVATAFTPANTTRVEIWQYPAGGAAGATNVAYDAAAAIYLSGFYTV